MKPNFKLIAPTEKRIIVITFLCPHVAHQDWTFRLEEASLRRREAGKKRPIGVGVKLSSILWYQQKSLNIPRQKNYNFSQRGFVASLVVVTRLWIPCFLQILVHTLIKWLVWEFFIKMTFQQERQRGVSCRRQFSFSRRPNTIYSPST